VLGIFPGHLDYGRRYTAKTNQVQRSFEDVCPSNRGRWISSSPAEPRGVQDEATNAGYPEGIPDAGDSQDSV
jgi:hypothetical protein